jgi:hypothetical protein
MDELLKSQGFFGRDGFFLKVLEDIFCRLKRGELAGLS